MRKNVPNSFFEARRVSASGQSLTGLFSKVLFFAFLLVFQQTFAQNGEQDKNAWKKELAGKKGSFSTATNKFQSQTNIPTVIYLNAGQIDVSGKEAQMARTAVAPFAGKHMHLVKFRGAIQPEWYNMLTAAGVQVVDYIPNYAYLVYGDYASISRLQAEAKNEKSPVEWDGEFTPAYRISPNVYDADGKGGVNKNSVAYSRFSVQLFLNPDDNNATRSLLNNIKIPLTTTFEQGISHYVNITVSLTPEGLRQISERPDVISIHPFIEPKKNDESQNMIMTGQLTGNAPTPGNYLSWLASKGFTQAQFDASNFVVNVSDDGLDNGVTGTTMNTTSHFGLYKNGDVAQGTRVAFIKKQGTATDADSRGCAGHGTLNSHIVGGYVPDALLTNSNHTDANGFRYGLGVAPFVKLGNSVVFTVAGSYTNPNLTNLESESYQAGGRISTNSWGAAVGGAYNASAQTYDFLVRDAQPAGSTFATAGNQEMVIFFSAGNSGSGANTIGSPGTAKNVITVGATEGVRPFGAADQCGVTDAEANSANDIIGFSSRGPCDDGRIKPDIVAPGTHITGGVYQAGPPANPPTSGGAGVANACFNATGVCAGPGTSNFFPTTQQWTTASSGTSHSTPATAGFGALIRQDFINRSLPAPSPAMTKAAIMASAAYMNGTGANDNLFSNNQGMGRVHMNNYFDAMTGPKIIRDQQAADMFTASGQMFVRSGVVASSGQPVRVTLAYTDVPGPTTGNAYVNNLDLEVVVNGTTYLGNVFSGANSVAGGTADPRNNVESVFLPAGTTGTILVKVKATNIAGDGVPNVGGALDQDFALIITNVTEMATPVLNSSSATIVSESCLPANGVIDPGETVTVSFCVQNVGTGNTSNLVGTLAASGGVTSPSGAQTYGTLVAGGPAVCQNFTFTAAGNCGDNITASLQFQDGASNLGTFNYTFRLGATVVGAPQTFSNATALTIPTSGAASVYPSTINVTGLTGTVNKMTLTLNGLNHTWPSDVDMLLVGPAGQKFVILSDVIGGTDWVNINYTLDDAAASAVPSSGTPASGTFRPTNYGTGDAFVAPAPAGPYSDPETAGTATFANVFNGTNPNGLWSLYVIDNVGGDGGSISGGWSLTITPAQPVCCNGACTPPVIAAPTVTQPTCASGVTTGTVVVNATSANTMEYSIDNGVTYQLSNTFSGLAAGSYNIRVREQGNTTCFANYSGNPVVINALPDLPVVTAPTVTQPLCPVLTGTIVVNATGISTLEYSVNGGVSYQASNTFAGLAPGNYNIFVRLQATPGCFRAYSANPVVINPVNPPLVVTHPVNRVICQNGNTTFSITDNIPLPAPTYQWQVSTNGGTTWTNLANVAPFSGTTTTTLTVTGAGLVYNGNLFRCSVTNICGTVYSNNASLTVNPLPIVNAGPSGLCAPVTIIASGNANTWAWTPAAGLSTTTGTTVIASPTSTTAYTVTGTITATGCQNSATVTVLGTPATPAIVPASPVICAGTIQPLTVAPITSTVTYSGAAMNMATSPSGPASVYPAVINVSGLPTSGVKVKSVTLNGISHTWPSDVDVLVQSPTGTNVIVMSDRGGSTDIINANLVFDDAAAAILPTTAISSGTYKPSNTDSPDNFAAPGPGSITNVNPTLSTFTGNFNGNWNLFVVDDLSGDGGSLTSWSITFEVPTAVWTPVTNLFVDPVATVPYVAGSAAATVYFTASPTTQTAYNYSVTSVLGTCTSPTSNVTVTVNPLPTVSVSPTGQCGPVSLTATGNSTAYTWSPAAGLNTTTGATVTANPQLNTTYTVTGTITATGCSKTATTVVNATPATPVVSPTAISICQNNVTPITIQGVTITSPASTGLITVPAGAPAVTAAGPASPYPTVISIGGLPTSGVRVKSVQINGINHTWPDDLDILLQSPTGTNVVLMSDAGGGTDLVNTNFVFDDAGTSQLSDGSLNASGTYKPTNYDVSDSWVAPGPGAVAQSSPALSMFTGNLNGNWNLYVVDDLGGDVGSITSWSITFEVVGAVWTPVAGLYTDAATTTAYTAGTMSPAVVYAKPTTTTTYTANRASATCTSGNATSVITVYNTVSITTQPASQTVCNGANVTFSLVSTGNSLTYQWQISTNGGTTWTNIANANAASLVLTGVTTAMNTYQYRCVVTNTCFTATSNAAILTVNALPTVTATDLWSRRVCISDTLVPLIGSPAGGNWSGIGVSGFNFVPPTTAVGTYVLTYTYTNTAGCTASDTTKIVVVDCPERLRLLRDNAVIVYPNPNNGQFNFRMNSVLYNYLGMDVFNTAGQRVYQKTFNGLVFGRVVPINLTHLPKGVYMIKFFYDDGARTSEKTFPVLIGE